MHRGLLGFLENSTAILVLAVVILLFGMGYGFYIASFVQQESAATHQPVMFAHTDAP